MNYELRNHWKSLLQPVGCEFLFKPLLAADTDPGSALPNGNHPSERYLGARYRCIRWAERH